MSAHLQKNFNPNKHMGPSPSNDTPPIYAVRFEHKLFLNECLRFGSDPFVTNANGRTTFHVACASSRSSQRTDKKRRELLQMLLDQPVKKEYQLPFHQWFGPREEKWNGQELCISSVCVSVGQGVVVVVCVCVCVCVCACVCACVYV